MRTVSPLVVFRKRCSDVVDPYTNNASCSYRRRSAPHATQSSNFSYLTLSKNGRKFFHAIRAAFDVSLFENDDFFVAAAFPHLVLALSQNVGLDKNTPIWKSAIYNEDIAPYHLLRSNALRSSRYGNESTHHTPFDVHYRVGLGGNSEYDRNSLRCQFEFDALLFQFSAQRSVGRLPDVVFLDGKLAQRVRHRTLIDLRSKQTQ